MGRVRSFRVQEEPGVWVGEAGPPSAAVRRRVRAGSAVLVCMSAGAVGLLDLDSISSCLPVCLNQQNGCRPSSLNQKVETIIRGDDYGPWKVCPSVSMLTFLMCSEEYREVRLYWLLHILFFT